MLFATGQPIAEFSIPEFGRIAVSSASASTPASATVGGWVGVAHKGDSMTSRVRASILAITFAAIVAIPSIAAAQEKAVVGVKAGINFAKIKGDDEDGAKSLAGAAAGLFVSKAISKSV